MMNIKHNLVDLHFIALQVVKMLPHGRNKSFNKGFTNFIEDFFQLLSDCSISIQNEDGSHDADLTIMLEVSYDCLRFKANKLPPEEKKTYWEGCELAAKLSLETLSLAFETITVNSEAA
jgi:hypothetical protein